MRALRSYVLPAKADARRASRRTASSKTALPLRSLQKSWKETTSAFDFRADLTFAHALLVQVLLRELREETRRSALHRTRRAASRALALLSSDRTRAHPLASQVLHVSLLRFVWDMETGERSKSQHAMTYPLQIDMGQYLPPDAHGNKREVWYDLKGVLMHKGVSAHHGHYVAQVYDERCVSLLYRGGRRIEADCRARSQSKWFLFDDETVTPIDDLNSPTTYDEDEAPVASKKRPSKGFIRDERGNMCVAGFSKRTIRC